MAATITAPLAALTTVFTPPCSISWLLTTTQPPSQYPPFPTTGPASCDPPGWATNIRDEGFQYYSPAICPSGFEVGPGCQITKSRKSEGFPTVRPGEIAVYCVPSGHTCTTDTTDFRGGVWGATSLDGIFTVGPALQIRFQQSDLSTLDTNPLTLSLAPFSTVLTAASVTAEPSKTSTSATASVGEPTTTKTTTSMLATSMAGTSSDTTMLATNTNAPSSTATDPLPTNAYSIDSQPSNGNTMNNSLAAILATALFITLVICAFLLVRIRSKPGRPRWRLPWMRQPKGLVPVGLGAWIGTRISGGESLERARQDAVLRNSQSGWDTEVGPPVLRLEFEKPLESLDNSAELEGDQELRLSRRASWISRMLSWVGRSSMTTRSSSRSRWTQRSLTMSGDWERLIQEKSERDDTEAGFLTLPEATYSRPTTMSSSMSHGDKVLGRPSTMCALPKAKVRDFDRLSQGTFGRVTVRAQSYHSSPSRNSKSFD